MQKQIKPIQRNPQQSLDLYKESFFSKVFIMTEEKGCWLWVGSRAGGRYGSFWFRKKTTPAHRVSWILHYGEIPNGIDVLHKCDNEPCVRPDHLFLGTHLENMLDAVKKGKFNNRKGTQNYHSKLTDKEVLGIRARYQSEVVPCRIIAKEFGVSLCTAQQIIEGRTWKHITNGVSIIRKSNGERQWNHKLTEIQVLEIRKLYATGNKTQQSLCNRFGISNSVMHRIIHRKYWKHI